MSCQVDIVRSNSFEMKYARFGQEGAQPIVILPGLSVQHVTDAADTVEAAYQKLAEAYEIYLFDRRSDVPPVYTVQEMTADTVQAMRMIGIDSAGIFGASQGGMMAQVMAIRYPEFVSAMALGSTACRLAGQITDTAGTWIRLAQEGAREPLMDAFARAVYTPSFYDQVKGILPAMAESITDEELSRFVVLAKGMEDFDLSGQLDQISCPTLVIGAGADAIFGPEAAAELAGGIGCELYMYEGYGHGVYDEAPDYVERLKRFFDSMFV